MPTDTPSHLQSQPMDAAGERYDAAAANAIESKWQMRWEERGSFVTPNPGQPGFERFEGKAKQYILDMFPYPSGVGLHVGHPLGYIATDIYARYLRAKGCHVLHAMGYDAFGLPAEQFAVEHGVHPRITTERNIATMRAQLKRLGLAHDPTRSVSTTDVGFYRWTQWIFLQIYNSWYDAEAINPAGGKGRARPISELVREFESGQRALPAGYSGTWSQLSEDDRRAIIDGYRLAYLAEVPVNWCPALGTVLANEEVTSDGRSERGNHPVYKRPLKQWMMRITAYAERLLDDLEPLAWPESTKMMQRNWIGRSEGAYIDFPVELGGRIPRSMNVGLGGESRDAIRVFTTRPDTLFGATYMVLAPEHPLVEALTAGAWPKGTPDAWKGKGASGGTGVSPADSPRQAVAAYRRFAEAKSELQRQADAKEKTGVFIGSYATNPATGKPIPIFIADYVLMGYGTGAIMAVPGQDQRDWDFATAFGLPIVRTVQPPEDFGDGPFLGDGPAMNSDFLNGLRVADAKKKMIAWLEEHGHGQGTTNYKLRDWLFSRQRYWGEPFPIIYDADGHPIALPESALPVELPPLEDFTPAASDDPKAPPQPPLGRAKEWINVAIDGKTYRRELNTMPQWAGSCWYYLRYLDPNNDQQFVDPDIERYWMLSEKRSGGTGFQPVREIPETGVPTSPELQRTRRWLPHWTVDGSTYFVTFRVRQTDLTSQERQVVLDACLHWNGQRARVYSAVVMPDHVHLIIKPLRKPDGEWWTLSELLRSVKGFSAREINKLRGVSGALWQEESFDRIIRDESEFKGKLDYIRMNPVRNGLVSQPSEYSWLAEPDAQSTHSSEEDSYRLKACATSSFDPAIHHLGGVDLYVGGVEHAVLHLLYARFWHKVLFDLGHVSTPEPFGRLFNQGYIQAYAYTDERGVYVPAEQVQEREGTYLYKGKPVARSYGKMGKSLKNALTPDDIFAEYGCDTLRLYEMYLGPLDQSKPWNTRDIIGSHRFLQRVWRNFLDTETGRWKVVETPLSDALRRTLHKTIAKVDEDMRSMRFNTAIAALIEFNNSLVALGDLPREAGEALVKMLAPFVPHLAAELWERLGHESEVMYEPFPTAEAKWLVDEEIEIPVQIMGKLRATITVPNGADEATAQAAAMANERIAELLKGKTIRKVIYVPNRLLNFVAN